MTLTKAIEAARDAFKIIAKRPDLPNPERDADWKNCMKWSSHEAHLALAALPDKPMTEEDVAEIIDNSVKAQIMAFGKWSPQSIVQDLKAANVLYVEEK